MRQDYEFVLVSGKNYSVVSDNESMSMITAVLIYFIKHSLLCHYTGCCVTALAAVSPH